uniref:Uncharacterized protein n=1 Tax=Chaetoceros debilis TaxID=122233 RepID=A0A7S3QIR6_9STRA|mmetsp:Transcript_29130/g.44462  ORF Transcript_29130/g.44462 Transcript_29130/m.44462 type:complete len:149 (-) Transcript_29130:228-674(-)|eukprot:CAMPEP_0194086692 /NCGR_PEP_ID=MMETSP0149-20130528/22085_1 /TAXON_ID=122233 /ORGANISM="Chaetoceros debilis, Strain MM31A-1" /LENGTH=148 /DNA_ID=CAMNT_0038769833 /DNA_START=104 /DNA_END=550 /DNA_ORIENTATION=+
MRSVNAIEKLQSFRHAKDASKKALTLLETHMHHVSAADLNPAVVSKSASNQMPPDYDLPSIGNSAYKMHVDHPGNDKSRWPSTNSRTSSLMRSSAKSSMRSIKGSLRKIGSGRFPVTANKGRDPPPDEELSHYYSGYNESLTRIPSIV